LRMQASNLLLYTAVRKHLLKTDIIKKVYRTCWDGNVVIKATSDGTYTVQ